MLIHIDNGYFFIRIDDPVFPNAGLRIQGVFQTIVQLAAGGRDYLNHHVRSPQTAAFSQFGRVADNRKIRFHPVFILRIQIDGKGGGNDFAGT